VMLDEVRGALPFSTSHWRADTLSARPAPAPVAA
jgi:hypothetical protein